MQIDTYYIITSKPGFLTKWPFDADLAALLGGPLLFRHGEGGRSAWVTEDHVAPVKLLFLASIKAEYAPALDTLPVTLVEFDLRWTFRRINGLDDLDEEVKTMSPAVFDGFQATGRPLVDAFIDRVRSRPARQPGQ